MDREVISHSRVLIVDDNQANVALLERVLQHAGYKNYQSVTDSRQFLDRFRVFQPDLILLDLMMPNVDGYAVMNQLRGWIPDGVYLPILVITADTSRNARQKALTLGAKDFLTKPIDTAEATLRIYNLLITRWLYRQMDTRNQFCMAQASLSAELLQAALNELERLTGKGLVTAENFTRLRFQLTDAAQAVEKLGREAAGSMSAPGLAATAFTGSTGGGV